MPSSSFLDTSYLLKAYALELHSEEVSRYIRRPGPDLLISALTDVEMACALRSKLGTPDGDQAVAEFQSDKQQGLYLEVPLPRELYDLARSLAARMGTTFKLRSLDLLHLATAKYYEADFLATYDERLAAAATNLGLTIVGARP